MKLEKNKQNGKFNKDTETIKKKAEILELKKTLNELKNSKESFNSRLNQAELGNKTSEGHLKSFSKKQKERIMK